MEGANKETPRSNVIFLCWDITSYILLKHSQLFNSSLLAHYSYWANTLLWALDKHFNAHVVSGLLDSHQQAVDSTLLFSSCILTNGKWKIKWHWEDTFIFLTLSGGLICMAVLLCNPLEIRTCWATRPAERSSLSFPCLSWNHGWKMTHHITMFCIFPCFTFMSFLLPSPP